MWVGSCNRNVLRLSSDQKTSQIVNILVKCGSPTAETPVRVQREETLCGVFLYRKLPAWVKEETKGLFPFWWYVGCVKGNGQ